MRALMRLSLSLAALLLALSGCAESHGDYPADSDPPPPDAGEPCRMDLCVRVDEDGCCDPSDSHSPISCGAPCRVGYTYAHLCGVCPTTPPPPPTTECDTAVSEWGFVSSAPSAETSATLDEILADDDGADRLVFTTPTGESFELRAPEAHVASLSVGSTVTLSQRYEGGFAVHVIERAGWRLSALRAYTRPFAPLVLGELTVAVGGSSCETRSACGLDRALRLELTQGFDDGATVLEPGDSVTFDPPIAGTAFFVTHGGAVEWGAESCEVFIPFHLSAVISETSIGG